MKIQIILRSGGLVEITPPEQFNFNVFISEVRDRNYMLLNGMFIPGDNIGMITQGDTVPVLPIPEPKGMMQ